MTYQQAALALFASLVLAGHQGQAPTAPSPSPAQAPAAKNARRPGSREVALVAKLKALLEPVGITVQWSALADPSKVKRAVYLVLHWDAYPDASEEMLPAVKVKDRPVSKVMRLEKIERRDGPLQSVYGFDLSTDQLFVAAVNAKSQLVGRLTTE